MKNYDATNLVFKRLLVTLCLLCSALLIIACGGDEEPTATPQPATSVPATSTPLPPTVVPPTATVEEQVAASQAESPLSAAFESPLQEASAMPLAAGKARLTGKVLTNAYTPSRFMDNTIVRLAPVVWNEEHTDSIFVLDGGESPGDITDATGTFVFQDLAPDDYVMIIGDVIGYHEVILNEKDEPKVFTAQPDTSIDLGTIEVSLE